MPTTKMPVWMRSEYVTIGQPPFREIRGQEAAPCGWGPTAYRYGQRQKQHSIGHYKKQVWPPQKRFFRAITAM